VLQVAIHPPAVGLGLEVLLLVAEGDDVVDQSRQTRAVQGPGGGAVGGVELEGIEEEQDVEVVGVLAGEAVHDLGELMLAERRVAAEGARLPLSDALLEELSRPGSSPQEIVLPTELLVRRSSGGA